MFLSVCWNYYNIIEERSTTLLVSNLALVLFCVVKGAKIATHKLTAASAKVLELEFIAAKVLIS